MPRKLQPLTKPHWTPRLLRMKLAEYDIKVKDFAEMVGLSPNHMSNILHGHTPLTKMVLLGVDDVLRNLEQEQNADSKGA